MNQTIDPAAPPATPQAAPPAAEPNFWELPEEAPSQDAPPATQPEHFFLQAETGTVYKTAEEAARGVAEKDRMIEAQKQQLAQARQLLAATGVHVGDKPIQPQTPPMLSALEAAVDRGDMTFDQALQALIQNEAQTQVQRLLSPLMPLIQHSSIGQAVEIAASKYDPNIPAFVRSPAYSKTLDQWPTLKGAIQSAATNPQFHTILPELLAQVYTVAKAAASAAAPIQRTTPTSTNPPQMVVPGAPQSLSGSEPLGTFEAEFAKIADIALTKESLGG